MYVPNNVKTDPLNIQYKDAQTIAVREKKNLQKLNLKSMKTKKLYKKILCSSGKQVFA